MDGVVTTRDDVRSDTLVIALFGLAIFASAGLIFLVQPMVGKRILPLFGGAPGVWSVCLAFYQTVLFLGYAYAHASSRWLDVQAQFALHATLAVVALVAPPVLPAASVTIAESTTPIASILGMLTLHVGAPFFLLAATGPLVQQWFVRCRPGRSPYPLYALSNLGSMLALFAYPFVIEPRFGLEATGRGWFVAFVLAVMAVLGCGFAAGWGRAADGAGNAPAEDASEGDTEASAPGAGEVVAWLGFAAGAVVAMMAITNHLCRDIASVPFLWILPLAAYLATLVLCFSMQRGYTRTAAVLLAIGALGLGALRSLLAALGVGEGDAALVAMLEGVPFEITRLCVLLFATCWLLHGELHRRRPAHADLTLFYLAMSGGGAIGGLFVGLVAPALFEGHEELVVAAVLALGFTFVAIVRDRRASVPAPLRVAVWILAIALVGLEVRTAVAPEPNQIHQERSFFGVSRVTEYADATPPYRVLLHGSTIHGSQFVSEGRRRVPTAYYGRASVVSVLPASRPGDRPSRIGVVGLGAGTISAYARPGDFVRFYEIDPAVVSIARDSGLFTYVTDHEPEPEIVVADARLAIVQEQAEGARQDFDFLVVDAFSSDAIPVHLLTVEAFRHYMAALDEDGVMFVHVSNRHFELTPVVSRIALELGLAHRSVASPNVSDLQTRSARWVLVSRDPHRLDAIEAASARRLTRLGLPLGVHHYSQVPPARVAATPLWTDDYSDLFGALRD